MIGNLKQSQKTLAHVGIAVFLFLVSFGLFFPARTGEFLSWDDETNVATNPHYLPVTLKSTADFWIKPFNELYTPVTNSLWSVSAAISAASTPTKQTGTVIALNPVPFHLLGALFHAGTAVLVFFLLYQLSGTSSGACIGALFWAIHPLQVESVAWVTGNNNVFCGFFSALTLLVYVRAAKKNQSTYWATVPYVMALLAKPTGVAVPLMVAVIEAVILRRPTRQWLSQFIVWSVMAIILAVFTRMSSPSSNVIHVDLWKRPVIALDAIPFYLAKIIAPVSMTIDYGRLPDLVAYSVWGYTTATLTVGLLIGFSILWRRGIQLPLAVLGLLIAGVFPVLGLVPYYFLRISTVGDRYLYLALLGPAFGIASGLSLIPTNRRIVAIAVAGIVLVALGVRTSLQIPVWNSNIALFTHAISVNPKSALSHNNLNIAVSAKGDYKRALSEAIRAVELAPNNQEYVNNLGIAYAQSGDLARAIASFREAVRMKPEDADAHYHLGVALVDSGNLAEAVPAFREAVQRDPQFVEAWYRLGTTLGKIGPATDAIVALSKTLELRPADTEARYIRAVLLTNAKRNAEAEADFNLVTEQLPNYAEAWYALGTVQTRLGKVADAKTAFERCLRIDPANQQAKTALAKLGTTRI